MTLSVLLPVKRTDSIEHGCVHKKNMELIVYQLFMREIRTTAENCEPIFANVWE